MAGRKQTNFMVDRVGIRYGNLTCVSYAGRNASGNTRWNCKCDCGNFRVVSTVKLTANEITHCGCLRKSTIIDMTGKKYNSLLCVEFSKINDRKESEWLWQCDCGTLKSIPARAVKNGNTKSCGCLKKEFVPANKKEKGVSSRNSLYFSYRSKAKKRNYDFDIEKDHFLSITTMNCHYCNIEPLQINTHSPSNGSCLYNGVDRIDNKKGYHSDNVVACCGMCNKSKSANTVEYFEEWILRAADHIRSRQQRVNDVR